MIGWFLRKGALTVLAYLLAANSLCVPAPHAVAVCRAKLLIVLHRAALIGVSAHPLFERLKYREPLSYELTLRNENEATDAPEEQRNVEVNPRELKETPGKKLESVARKEPGEIGSDLLLAAAGQISLHAPLATDAAPCGRSAAERAEAR
eukprot:6182364-Pleurochrysis_carterae.AAC.4